MRQIVRGLTIFFLLFYSTASYAVTAPQFPTCLNPQGTLKAYYTTGTHGIVGDPRTFTGSDAVYLVTPDLLFQCFCPENGEGVQTNWIKATSFSQSLINAYKQDGWLLIPNGAAWGLEDTAWLAKNVSYVCIGGRGGAELGQILGLATTGNLKQIVLLFASGSLLLFAGKKIKKI